MLGNRGVRRGDDTNEEIYYGSVTLEFHGGRKQWVGNIGFNDNHVELLDTFYPEGINYVDNDSGGTGGVTVPDNIFYNDSADDENSGAGTDVYLTLVSSIEEDCTLQSEFD